MIPELARPSYWQFTPGRFTFACPGNTSRTIVAYARCLLPGQLSSYWHLDVYWFVITWRDVCYSWRDLRDSTCILSMHSLLQLLAMYPYISYWSCMHIVIHVHLYPLSCSWHNFDIVCICLFHRLAPYSYVWLLFLASISCICIHMYWGACLDPMDLPSGFYSCIGLVACEDPDEDFPATPTSGIYHVYCVISYFLFLALGFIIFYFLWY